MLTPTSTSQHLYILLSHFRDYLTEAAPRPLAAQYSDIMIHLGWSDALLYRSLMSVNMWYNFGFMSFAAFIVQVVTGFFLACYYDSNTDLSFDSIQFIVREVKFMWITRFVHANVASWAFLFLYLHITKALLFGVYRAYKELMWLLGISILFIALLVGFSGYSLVWGQMSYWAMTVICNLATVIPIYGYDVLEFLWGNSVLTTYSLRRFFCIHFLMPFILLALGLVHMLVGHKSATGHLFNMHACEFDRVPFGYTILIKDIYSMWFILLIVVSMILLNPKALMHPDNYLYAMAYVTPVSIEPEWYFLPYYGLLRSVPHKLLGVLSLVAGVVVLAVLSLISSYDHCSAYMHRTVLVSYLLNFIYLGYFAVFPVSFPYVDIALLLVWLHFATLIVFV